MSCKKPYHFILILLSFVLISCGVSSNVLMSSGGYNLGTLPNGSSVVVSQQTFTASGGGSTTGSIGLAGGTSGTSFTLSFSVNPSGPIVSSVPNPCVITSGSGQVCQLNFGAAAANAGTYLVTVSYTQNLTTKSGNKIQINAASGAPKPLAQSITFIVSSNPPVPPVESGTLVISALAESSILVGGSTTATVTLSGSESITTPISVNITSQSSAVMTVAPQTCSLTTASNICTITLTGVESGSATFSAAASGYTTVTSTALIIAAIPPMSPGTLVISALAESSILVGESTTATVTLTSSIGITTPITVNITSESLAVMTVAPTTCSLTTESNTCTITLTGVAVGSATFSAAASGYSTVTSTALTVVLPTESGILTISALGSSSISVGESTTATVTLESSSGITTPITVSITSESSAVMTVSPTTCSLTTESNTCVITLTGVSAGSTTFSAAASGYATVTSATLTVTSGVTGMLEIFAGIVDHSGAPTPGPATSSLLSGPSGVGTDSSGNLYIADSNNGVIEKVTPAGTLSIFAGMLGSGGAPTPGPATSSKLDDPYGVAVDSLDNVYIADRGNNLIEKITLIGGIESLSILAGNGSQGVPMPGPATSSELNDPSGVAVDSLGNVYIADADNYVIEKVILIGGIESLSIFAGNGSYGAPTPGPATSTSLSVPNGVAVDESGSVYIADYYNTVVEKVTLIGGIESLSIFAGIVGDPGEPTAGPATSSRLNYLYGVAVDSLGNVYIADTNNSVIEKITLIGGIESLSIFAGTGSSGNPTPGPATSSALSRPQGVAIDASGNVYIADTENALVEKVY